MLYRAACFFFFLWCQPQIPTVHTPTDHVAHIQAELGCLIWARMQIELLNFHNKINLVSMHTWHLRPLENTFREKRGNRVGRCLPKLSDKRNNFVFRDLNKLKPGQTTLSCIPLSSLLPHFLTASS